MKYWKNKKLPLLLSLAVFASFASLVFFSTTVHAGGDPNLSDPTLALCYIQNGNPYQIQAINLSTSEGTACEQIGGRIIRGGEAVPVPVCVIGDKVQQYSEGTSAAQACTNVGGVPYPTGGTFPRINAPTTDTTTPASPDTVNCKDDDGGSVGCLEASDCTGGSLDSSNCGIIKIVILLVNVLSAILGVVIVAVLVMSGIQYSTSGGDPQKAAEARKHIGNALFALVAFGMMYAFLQWIVPGGVF